MTDWWRRALAWGRFMVREYVRSGRVLVEIVAMVTAIWTLFWPRGSQAMSPEQFFTLAGLFVLALACYTTLMILRLGYHPQGSVVISRALGRSGYLSGLYLAALAIVALIYLSLSLIVLALHWRTPLFSIGTWLLGSLPLLLDAAIVAALMLLLVPLVVPGNVRLVVLGLVVLVLSQDRDILGRLPGQALLEPLQTILGLPLVVIFGGFNLAVGRVYNLTAIGILLGQALFVALLLACALLAFNRRELIFR